MTAALLVGLGAVGSRAARQLVDDDHLERLFVSARHQDHAAQAAKAFGHKVEAYHWEPGAPFPEGVSVVVCAAPDPVDAALATAASEVGLNFVSCNDSHVAIDRYFDLAEAVEAHGAVMVAGAGLAPGLSDLLVVHAAASFEAVDEIRVARSGWSGPASVTTLRHELRPPVVDRHNAQWRTLPRTSEEIVFFPDPIGARDCVPARLGIRLLAETFRNVARISVATSEPVSRVKFHRHRRRGDETQWGATRVEVWGRRSGGTDVVVYGAIDRTAIAAGTVLAVSALVAIGAVDAGLPSTGVVGLGSCSRPTAFFDELSARGVRAAVFEGAPVSD